MYTIPSVLLLIRRRYLLDLYEIISNQGDWTKATQVYDEILAKPKSSTGEMYRIVTIDCSIILHCYNPWIHPLLILLFPDHYNHCIFLF